MDAVAATANAKLAATYRPLKDHALREALANEMHARPGRGSSVSVAGDPSRHAVGGGELGDRPCPLRPTVRAGWRSAAASRRHPPQRRPGDVPDQVGAAYRVQQLYRVPAQRGRRRLRRNGACGAAAGLAGRHGGRDAGGRPSGAGSQQVADGDAGRLAGRVRIGRFRRLSAWPAAGLPPGPISGYMRMVSAASWSPTTA